MSTIDGSWMLAPYSTGERTAWTRLRFRNEERQRAVDDGCSRSALLRGSIFERRSTGVP